MMFLLLSLWFVMALVLGVTDSQPRCQQVLRGEYDYIIVGGGSTGSVLAARLSENEDLDVLLLEAGSLDTEIFESHVIDTPGLAVSLTGSDIDWKYKTVPQQHCCSGLKDNRVPISRGKVLGGTSAIDDMTYMRGSPHVFDLWEEMGSKGWNRTDVLPYFIKAEDYIASAEANNSNPDYRGSCGPLMTREQKTNARHEVFMKGTQELGWPIVRCNSEEEIGICKTESTIKNGERISTSKAYLSSAMDRENLDVLTNAKVYKIDFDSSKRASGVLFKYNGKDYDIEVKNDVIVSAGAVGSPKLLMLSGIGPRKHLQKLNIPLVADLPVGENLQDGYVVPIRIYLNTTTQRPDKALLNVQKWRDYIYLRQGDLAESHVESHLQLRTLPSKITQYPDLHVAVHNMLPDYDHALLKKLNIHDYVIETRKKCYNAWSMETSAEMIEDWYSKGLSRDGVLVHLGILHPQSRGSIMLNTSNPDDPPLIDPQYLLVPDDVEDILKGIRFLQALLDMPSFKAANAEIDKEFSGCSYLEFDSDDYWRCFIQNLGYSANTPTGSVRMGRLDDITAVVDTGLRVKEVNGLRVADSSIMPETTGFTRASEVMIGEKLADMIHQQLEYFNSQPQQRNMQGARFQAPQINSVSSTTTEKPLVNEKINPSPKTGLTKQASKKQKEPKAEALLAKAPHAIDQSRIIVMDNSVKRENQFEFFVATTPLPTSTPEPRKSSTPTTKATPMPTTKTGATSPASGPVPSDLVKDLGLNSITEATLPSQSGTPFEITPEQKNQDIMTLLEQLLINEVSKNNAESISSLEKALAGAESLTTTEKQITTTGNVKTSTITTKEVRVNNVQRSPIVSNKQESLKTTPNTKTVSKAGDPKNTQGVNTASVVQTRTSSSQSARNLQVTTQGSAQSSASPTEPLHGGSQPIPMSGNPPSVTPSQGQNQLLREQTSQQNPPTSPGNKFVNTIPVQMDPFQLGSNIFPQNGFLPDPLGGINSFDIFSNEIPPPPPNLLLPQSPRRTQSNSAARGNLNSHTIQLPASPSSKDVVSSVEFLLGTTPGPSTVANLEPKPKQVQANRPSTVANTHSQSKAVKPRNNMNNVGQTTPGSQPSSVQSSPQRTNTGGPSLNTGSSMPSNSHRQSMLFMEPPRKPQNANPPSPGVNKRPGQIGIEPPTNNAINRNNIPSNSNLQVRDQQLTQNIQNEIRIGQNGQFISQSSGSNTNFFIPDSFQGNQNTGSFSNEISSNLFIPDSFSNTNNINFAQNVRSSISGANSNAFLPPTVHSNFPRSNSIVPNPQLGSNQALNTPNRQSWNFKK